MTEPASTPRSLTRVLGAAILALSLAPAGIVHGATDEGEQTVGKAEYVKFHPDFVVNLKSPEPHFLMVTVQGMSRGEEGILAAKHHMAAIRHHILMLLSEQTPESIASTESKQKLMDDALEKIQTLLVSETGKPSIEAVYFTDFVVE